MVAGKSGSRGEIKGLDYFYRSALLKFKGLERMSRRASEAA